MYREKANERQANCPVTNTLPLYCSGGGKMGVFFGVRPRRGQTPACVLYSNHNSDHYCGTASWSAFCPMPLCDMKYISNRFLHPLGLHKLCDVYTYKERAVALFFSAATACV